MRRRWRRIVGNCLYNGLNRHDVQYNRIDCWHLVHFNHVFDVQHVVHLYNIQHVFHVWRNRVDFRCPKPQYDSVYHHPGLRKYD